MDQTKINLVLKTGPFSASFICFVFSTVKMFIIKICQWLDLSCWSLVLETTALEAQLTVSIFADDQIRTSDIWSRKWSL